MDLPEILDSLDRVLIKLEEKQDWGLVTELGKVREALNSWLVKGDDFEN